MTDTTTLTQRTTDTIQIGNHDVSVKEYKGERVVTLKDVDTVHERASGTSRKRFNDNKKRFIENEDYFKVCASEIRTNKIMDISPKFHQDIVFLTESGYLMLVKSFTDDLAWEVQRQLINTYFKVKQVASDNLILAEKNIQLSEKVDKMEKSLQVVTNLLTAKPLADMKSINTWKKQVAKPLVKKIEEATDRLTNDCYKMVYRVMTEEYGFCPSSIISQFENSYECENYSTINAIAIHPTYQEWFVRSAKKMINFLLGAVDTMTKVQVQPDTDYKTNDTVSDIVPTTVDVRKFTINDNVENVIAEIAKIVGDKTENKLSTRRKIYSKITTQRGWKQLMTRHRCQSKKDVVDKVETCKRKFVKVCNEMVKVA